MYTYLILLAASLFFPLGYSFDKRISFYKRWSSLFPSIISVALFFIGWDIYFTKHGIWSFNPNYILGLEIFSLPLEECLFFIVVPYSCIFIYDALNYFIKKDYLQSSARYITLLIIILLLLLGIINWERDYTFVTFTLTAIFLALHYAVFKEKYLGRFYVAYVVHLIPFFIINGVLTSFPVVLYNDTENLGVRIGSIPVEDSIYSMLLLLMNITMYEYLNSRKQTIQTKSVLHL